MGLLDGLLGNASEVEPGKMQDEFGQVLGEGERVEKAYVLIRDAMLFTNKRLVLVDSGHVIPRSLDRVRETVDWLDRYLGPVERAAPASSR